MKLNLIVNVIGTYSEMAYAKNHPNSSFRIRLQDEILQRVKTCMSSQCNNFLAPILLIFYNYIPGP